jgi:hypothetical protein
LLLLHLLTEEKVKFTPSVAEDEALVNSLCSRLRTILNQKNSALEDVQEHSF